MESNDEVRDQVSVSMLDFDHLRAKSAHYRDVEVGGHANAVIRKNHNLRNSLSLPWAQSMVQRLNVVVALESRVLKIDELAQ